MTTHTVRANGLRFAYLEEGRGPLVLLLHGFPDTAHTWSHVMPALAGAGFRAVAPFMRGYFPTEIPAEEAYDADTLGRDALAIVRALGESEAVVVGHDWGASAAFSAAGLAAMREETPELAAPPVRVRLLVTLAIPHPATVLPTPRVLWTLRHFFSLSRPNAAAKIRAEGFATIDMLVERWSSRSSPWSAEPGAAPSGRVPEAETEAVKQAFREPGCLEAALGYYRAVGVRLPLSQRRKVVVPAVAFAGTDDNVPVQAYERARKHYEAHYEVVPVPGGHFMHREHPAAFTKAFVDAVTRLAHCRSD